MSQALAALPDFSLQPTAPAARGAIADGATEPLRTLCSVGRWLSEENYRFVCPTPTTHARVNARSHAAAAATLRDVFGWSRPFEPRLLPARVLRWLEEADALDETDGLLRSRVRYASIGDRLFVHSAFPTTTHDAVFFGPDTYRFVNFVQRALAAYWPHAVRSLADVGCGSGAGAIHTTQRLDRNALRRVVLSDINPQAVQFAATNVALNAIEHAVCVQGDSLSPMEGCFDLIIANPPYMIDREHRAYRDGGAHWGVDLALRFLRDAIPRLAPGGRLMLYTGTPIVHGQDLFHLACLPILEQARLNAEYTEIDPDVFGEELDLPEYAAVDRIAAVGLIVQRPARARA